MFLEAIRLEQELKKKAPPVVVQKQVTKEKMTNKERNRYNDLQKEIEKLEAKILGFKEEMVSAGFAKLSELQTKLDASESKLEILFTEWADLESKL
jgi:uncharacterized protein YlxW (UPF0749 family)